MKIIINATILDERPSGLGIYTLNVIKELSLLCKDKYKIIVFTSSAKSLNGLDVEIRNVHKCLQPRFGIRAGILRFLWVQFVFPLILLKERYDIIYHTTHHGMFLRGKARKQIITIQNDVDVTFNFPKQHILQYYYFKYIIPHLLRASSAVITTSAYAREVLLRHYGSYIEDCYYVYNSYNKNLFALLGDTGDRDVLDMYGLKDKNYVLIVGATYEHKNIAGLLKAFIQIKKKLRHLQLCIAGYRKTYIDSLRDLILDSDIIMIPYVPQENLAALYKHASCLAFPSLHESFGIPCIEAMACGCPVVASNTACFPEVCGDAAYYIDPHDELNIASGIHKVITDNELRQVLIDKGMERAKSFSWKRSAKKIIEILEETHKNNSNIK